MKLGEVVEIGRHRVMCGDSFNKDHLDLLMNGEKPKMAYCDPPYGIKLDPGNHNYIKMGLEGYGIAQLFQRGAGIKERHDVRQIINDDIEFDPRPLIDYFSGTREQFWWGANYYMRRLPDGGSWIAWDKRITEKADKMFGSAFELCWSREPHQYKLARVKWAGVYGTEREPGKRRFHPAHKPVLLAEWFIDKWSKPTNLVVDLFGGAGGSLLACERLHRRCFIMELSPEYCDLIVERYHKMTHDLDTFPQLPEDEYQEPEKEGDITSYSGR